jgi:hypothetical protein
MNRRRTFLSSLAAVGTVSLTGCSDNLLDTGPKLYPESIESELILTDNDFSEEWVSEPTDQNNSAVYGNEDESVTVAARVEVESSITEAENAMSSARDRFRDPQDIEIAGEAFWDTQDSFAQTHIRHVNAVGLVASASVTVNGYEPDVSRSQEYARALFNKWKAKYPSATAE